MTIYIVDIEPIDTRYTAEWSEHVPTQLKSFTNQEVITISGTAPEVQTTPGAFLNFSGTNAYKSQQMEKIAQLVSDNKIKSGDYFLFTDAWNPTVIQLKYMMSLLNIDAKIGGMWHAGSYDRFDFLGRMIGNKPWVRFAELSMYNCYDHNFFATDYHIDLFKRRALYGVSNYSSIVKTGWPMEYLPNTLNEYVGKPKKDLILFPHRIATEKQPSIFEDLQKSLPEYTLVMCQESKLTKQEYHTLLSEAKVIFSANLQETLGISWYEGALVGAIPMLPDRLSYSEMALNEFKYPSKWTDSLGAYIENKDKVIDLLTDYMENYSSYVPSVNKQADVLKDSYFSGKVMYQTIADGSK